MRLFCKLCGAVEGESDEPILFGSDAGVVLLSEDWAVQGHIVVASSKHVENLSDLEDPADFTALLTYAERLVLQVTGADRAILMKLGLAVPHLHVHIYPVSRSAKRSEIFEAIDMKRRVEMPDDEREAFVEQLRLAMQRG